MNPVILHVNRLAQEVEKKLGSEITPESVQASVELLCAHDWRHLRARVAAEVCKNLGLEMVNPKS